MREYGNVEIEDETLRDGLQATHIFDLDIEQKKRILEYQEAMGIQHSLVGFPSSDLERLEDVETLLIHIHNSNLKILPWVLCRVDQADVDRLLDLYKKVGIRFGISLFLPVTQERFALQKWSSFEKIQALDIQLNGIEKYSLPVCFSIEDMTRSSSHFMGDFFNLLKNHRLYSFGICDTTGIAVPEEVKFWVDYVGDQFSSLKAPPKILWHGHNDRGMAMANAWQAIQSGAQVVSGTILGIGERAGNIPIDQVCLLLNEKYNHKFCLKNMVDYSRYFAREVNHPVGPLQPISGSEVCRSGSGIHVAVEYLEKNKIEKTKSNSSYNSLPLARLGLRFEAVLGPHSGRKNLKFVLESLDLEVKDPIEEKLLKRIRSLNRCISATELMGFVRELNELEERV